MPDKFKEEIEASIKRYKEFGPSPGDCFTVLAGVGKIVVRSKTLPSGLIIEPVQENEHGTE